MDPLTLALGLGSGAVSPLLDLLTGASRKRKEAQEAQLQQYDAAIADTKNQMGRNVTDSLGFRTATSQLDKGMKKAGEKLTSSAAAAGATDEARLGQVAALNEGYSSGLVAALNAAEQRRQQLQQQYNALTMGRANVVLGNANQDLAMQSQYAGGIAGVMPYLLPKPKVTGGTNGGALGWGDITNDKGEWSFGKWLK